MHKRNCSQEKIIGICAMVKPYTLYYIILYYLRLQAVKNADELLMPIRLSASLSVCLLALICECLQKNIPEDTTKTFLGSSTYTCVFSNTCSQNQWKMLPSLPQKRKSIVPPWSQNLWEHGPNMVLKSSKLNQTNIKKTTNIDQTWSQMGAQTGPGRLPEAKTYLTPFFPFFWSVLGYILGPH